MPFHWPRARPPHQLLTGANCGGKTTLLREVCLAVVMAQIGCYTAAHSCRLSLADRVMMRCGAADRIMAGQSTFMVELRETSNMLRYATRHSFVALDELGRGTATYDGYAIAYAVLRHLLTTTQCRTIFSTHHLGLCTDFAGHPEVRLGHMLVTADEKTSEVTFLYKLGMGVVRLRMRQASPALAPPVLMLIMNHPPETPPVPRPC
ncbi:putative DNA mismatch repair protein Msh6 [Paratrimastix pyriformis]|uniref:DNA mismatch repair protein Msh6 n=1 Tax=Paratrimastix pyriformis TaxID=342808 RepID=A0ABQ8UI41_9EUKA|nr:putative DNA mismatch repair protein Msh6 [Paratrimastix pyriformis]